MDEARIWGRAYLGPRSPCVPPAIWNRLQWKAFWRELARQDREAWAEYRKQEKERFPLDPANPLKDPPGMAAARRAIRSLQRSGR